MYSVQAPQYYAPYAIPTPMGGAPTARPMLMCLQQPRAACGVPGCPCPPARLCEDCGKRICEMHTMQDRRSQNLGRVTRYWTDYVCPACKQKAARSRCIASIVCFVIVAPIVVVFLWFVFFRDTKK